MYPELEDPVRLEEFRKYVDIISDHAYPMDAGVVEEVATRYIQVKLPSTNHPPGL